MSRDNLSLQKILNMSSAIHYDDLLFPILSSEETIFGFFDRIFEFLYRNTDFFKLKGVDSDEFGLVNGEAEKIVRSIFCKYMEEAAAERRNLQTCGIETVPLDCVAEETVVTTTADLKENVARGLDESTTTLNKNETFTSEGRTADEQPNVPVMDSDSFNGACYEDYSWSQSIKDTDIHIRVPCKVSSGKQVRVDIRQSRLKVELRGEGDSWSVLKEGDLSWLVNVEESTWTLVPYEHVHICLQKMQERWWDTFFVGEPKIDLKSIDPSVAYEELDPDSRAKIQELMHDEYMKRLGKPTVQQSKIENILKEAWDKEGSPFKGQPFDPSIVNVQNS